MIIYRAYQTMRPVCFQSYFNFNNNYEPKRAYVFALSRYSKEEYPQCSTNFMNLWPAEMASTGSVSDSSFWRSFFTHLLSYLPSLQFLPLPSLLMPFGGLFQKTWLNEERKTIASPESPVILKTPFLSGSFAGSKKSNTGLLPVQIVKASSACPAAKGKSA